MKLVYTNFLFLNDFAKIGLKKPDVVAIKTNKIENNDIFLNNFFIFLPFQTIKKFKSTRLCFNTKIKLTIEYISSAVCMLAITISSKIHI